MLLKDFMCFVLISEFQIYSFFSDLKNRKIYWYKIIHCVQIFFIILCFVHVIACNFILIGASWIKNLNISSTNDIYINAFYWSISSIAHDTLGDIISTSSNEKLYTCFIQFLSCFVFALTFGSIISFITTISHSLRNKLYQDYSHVLSFLKKKDIDNKFSSTINDYFNDL